MALLRSERVNKGGRERNGGHGRRVGNFGVFRLTVIGGSVLHVRTVVGHARVVPTVSSLPLL